MRTSFADVHTKLREAVLSSGSQIVEAIRNMFKIEFHNDHHLPHTQCNVGL